MAYVWHVVNGIVRHWWDMAREDLHFRLRIPAELKSQVEEAAENNHRSMTAEIVDRLENSFDEETAIEELSITHSRELKDHLETISKLADGQVKLMEYYKDKIDILEKQTIKYSQKIDELIAISKKNQPDKD